MRNFQKLIPALFLAALLFSCTTSQKQNDPYFSTIQKERDEKDAELRDPENTPLDSTRLPAFTNLPYFAIDEEYRVEASLVRNPTPDTFLMETTTDRRPVYTTYGKATFVLNGQTFEVSLFQNQEAIKSPGMEKYIFFPFRDNTSGTTTYGGGRYLDLFDTLPNTIIIDFNRAYNPYCSYNDRYSCPVPPLENTLSTNIEAGEKAFDLH